MVRLRVESMSYRMPYTSRTAGLSICRKSWKRSGNEPVTNVTLWKRLLKAQEPHEVAYFWVKGHDGHPQNERCDALATAAADQENRSEDDLGE